MRIRIKGFILLIAIAMTLTALGLAAFSASGVSNTPSSSIQSTDKYILGEFEGFLAIYKSSSKKPIEIIDVRVDSLPERDVERIKRGIYANSLSEIISLAEDYE